MSTFKTVVAKEIKLKKFRQTALKITKTNGDKLIKPAELKEIVRGVMSDTDKYDGYDLIVRGETIDGWKTLKGKANNEINIKETLDEYLNGRVAHTVKFQDFIQAQIILLKNNAI
jgi:hypothetical protein